MTILMEMLMVSMTMTAVNDSRDDEGTRQLQ